MRWWPLGVLVAIASGAAGATSAATSPQPALYRATIEFAIHYQVDWSGKQGDPTPACSTWRTWHGSNSVIASNLANLDDDLQRLRGYVAIWPSERTGSWGTFTATGRARLHIRRQLIQNGENCDNGVSTPWVPPPTDCGERSLVTQARIGASMRIFDGTLDASATPPARRANPTTKSIDVWAAPSRVPFQNCGGGESPASFLVSVGFPVDNASRDRLKGLAPGRKLSLWWRGFGGRCTAATPRQECSFLISGHVWVTRWRHPDRP